jgi:hypothetical protein
LKNPVDEFPLLIRENQQVGPLDFSRAGFLKSFKAEFVTTCQNAPAMLDCGHTSNLMNTWKYMRNGQPVGPVETTALQTLLKDGTVPPDTLVMREGGTDWVPANTVPELQGVPVAGSIPPAAGATAAGEADADDIEKNKVFAVLAYIGILFLVPLLAAPQSRFARYHTNQGIVLFLASIIGPSRCPSRLSSRLWAA